MANFTCLQEQLSKTNLYSFVYEWSYNFIGGFQEARMDCPEVRFERTIKGHML